jgi:pimeloyl-ACP methyl ester carboxylesterase
MMTDLQRIELDDAIVGVHDSGGSGPPVLLLHAGVFGAWFEPLAADPALADHRVVQLRRAGYVEDAAPPGPVTVEAHAAHAAAVLDALDTGPAVVVGHSSGSVIALQVALDRPDLVRALVLGEPPLIDGLAASEDLEFLQTAVGPVIGGAIGAASAGDVDTAFDSFMSVICGPGYVDVLVESLGADAPARARDEAGFFFTDEIIHVGQWTLDDDHAAAIDVPVVLVQGGDSPPPVHRLVERTAARLADATVVTVPGDDHLLPLRNPAALAAVVADLAT